MPIVQFLFSFEGRISRQPFWLWIAFLMVIALVPIFLLRWNTEEAEKYFNILLVLTLWPGLAIQAKRWHDRNKSAWWILLNFIPIIGNVWVFVENGFLVGTPGDNKYGKDPLRGRS